jgi:dTMP kinase
LTSNSKGVGKFIVFEGAHASGKTTVAKQVVKALTSKGIRAIYTKEPFSNQLKPVIERFSRVGSKDSTALAFLIAADRSLHLARISQWVKEGKYVICDRYKLSSLVYQRIDGLDKRIVEQINNTFVDPDSTFLILTSLKQRRERLSHAKRNPDHRFLSPPALAAEQRYYEEYAQCKMPGLQVIDGAIRVEEIVARVMKLLDF